MSQRYMCMLTKVISIFSTKLALRCRNVISWKHSYSRLNEEYEIAIKKKKALDGLYEKGKISQSTHSSFNTEIASAIAEIEKQQQDLIQKMQAKTDELQNQIRTLEVLLANYEIQHVTGEIDENTYTLEINLIANGLDTARRELETIQNATNQLNKPVAEAVAAESAPEPVLEAAPVPIPKPAEIPVAAPPVDVAPSYVVSAPEPIIAPVAEAAPVIVIEDAPAPISEAPVAETAPVIETTPETVAVAPEAAPIAEAPVEAPVTETPEIEEVQVVEAPAVETPIIEQSTIIEEAPAVIEESESEILEAEIPAVEPSAVVEEAESEKSPLDEFEVAQPDIVQKELLQVVEEIAENPLVEAPSEAQEEAAADIPTEVSAETQPASSPAKETLHAVEAADSSEGKE